MNQSEIDLLLQQGAQTESSVADLETQTLEPDEWNIILPILENAMSNQPRSLQTELGPSELGTDCLHCLAAKMVGWEQHPTPSWRAWIGTAVHAQHEQVFLQLNGTNVDDPTRPLHWKTEYPVISGHLSGLTAGYDIGGHIDLWDRKTNATIDWKIVGPTTLKNVRARGASQQYQVQASLYGIGLQNQGAQVDRSCIFFLPLGELDLRKAIPWEAKFSPVLGQWALERANLLMTFLDLITSQEGKEVRDAWITNILPRTGTHCFDCDTFDDSPNIDLLGTKNQTPVPPKWVDLAELLPSTYTPVSNNNTTK